MTDIDFHEIFVKANNIKMTPARVRAIRKSYDMTQILFAELLGIKYETYRCWEKGTRYPSSPACALLLIAEDEKHLFLKNIDKVKANIQKWKLYSSL